LGTLSRRLRAKEGVELDVDIFRLSELRLASADRHQG